MAMTLQAAFLVLVTVAFFESFGYEASVPIVAGLITALSTIAGQQRRRPVVAGRIADPRRSQPTNRNTSRPGAVGFTDMCGIAGTVVADGSGEQLVVHSPHDRHHRPPRPGR